MPVNITKAAFAAKQSVSCR